MIKQILIVGGLMVPTTSWALDGGLGGGGVSLIAPIGTCSVLLDSNLVNQTAAVFLFDGGGYVASAGANEFGFGGTIVAVPATISTSDIESCGLTGVTNLQQDGANGTYAGDSEIFFRFRATDPGDGQTYDYEFALRGASNTQAIVTKVLAPADDNVDETDATADAETIQRPVSEFMQARAANVLATLPNLSRFLIDEDDAAFAAEASRGQGRLSFSSGTGGAFWADFEAAWSNQDETDSSYVVGTIGTHFHANENLLLGLMISADRAEDNQSDADIEGTGWLAGPYFVARLPGQPLFFEGRALYGETDNDIDMGSSDGDFDTERTLLQARVTGEIARGDLTLFPHLDFSQIKDDQDDFTTSDDVDIPDQKIKLSALTLGLDFDQPIAVASGDFSLVGGVSAIWSETDGDGIPRGTLSSGEDMRGRVDFGFNYALSSNNTVSLDTFYDGIGADDFEGYGMSLNWALDF